MNKADMYMEYLASEGYRPHIDSDGDVAFKHEGGQYVVFTFPDDVPYFRLMYPAFWEIESEDERGWSLIAMSEVNSDRKAVKLYPYRNNVYASVEMFLEPIETFKPVFQRCLRAIKGGVDMFRDRMRQLREEAEAKTTTDQPNQTSNN